MSELPTGSIYTGNETYTSSVLQSYTTDPNLLSLEIKNMGDKDEINKSIKYAKPKYMEVKKTYEIMKPITKEAIQLPTKQSKKIRSTKPVFQEPIYLNKDQMSQVLKDNKYFGEEANIPLPTQSTINNLINASVFDSTNSSINLSNYYSQPQKSKMDPNIYESKMAPYNLQSNQQQSYKQSKHSLQQTNNEDLKPVVYEGTSLQFSQNEKIQQSNNEKYNQSKAQKSYHNSMKQSNANNSKISKQSNMMGQYPMNQSNVNQQSVHPSKMEKSNLPQSSVHPSKVQKSNVSQNSMKNSNYPQGTSLTSKIKEYNQNNNPLTLTVPGSNMFSSNNSQQSMNQSNQPHLSVHPRIPLESMQQSNISKNSINPSKMNQSNVPQGSIHSTKIKQSNVPQGSIHSTKMNQSNQNTLKLFLLTRIF